VKIKSILLVFNFIMLIRKQHLIKCKIKY